MVLLSTAYFAPIQYYSKLVREEQIVMERREHYSKQSYRNRCTIYSANGLLDLVVPVAKANQPNKVFITEVEISYDTLWQKLHFKAIESAYRRSPFYEYYMDELTVFFNQRHRYLYEFNMKILRTICRLMNITLRIHENLEYIKCADEGVIDLRNRIHPKLNPRHTDTAYVSPQYAQVFADKWGFKPNLSILDLLFNTGPAGKELL